LGVGLGFGGRRAGAERLACRFVEFVLVMGFVWVLVIKPEPVV